MCTKQHVWMFVLLLCINHTSVFLHVWHIDSMYVVCTAVLSEFFKSCVTVFTSYQCQDVFFYYSLPMVFFQLSRTP